MYGRDAAPLFRQYAELTDEALADYSALDTEIATAITAVDTERRDLCAALAVAYLPELTEPALQDAERRTGLRSFSQRKPLDALVREERKLHDRIARLEADERWTRRDALVGPLGKWTRALAEANEMLEPWERDCQRFEALEGFLELVEVGYDTPGFAERWWQPQYWRHWSLGDKICSALELADFGDDVLPAYDKSRLPRDQWRGEVTRITENMRQIHDHVRERDQAVWRLQNLTSIYLDECRTVLADHLQRADVGLLATWAGADRGVTIHLKRLSGLAAKREMFDEMRAKWIAPVQRNLGTARTKFATKANKYARPKKARVQVAIPDGFPEKMHAQAARRAKARATVQRISRWNAYDRFDLDQPPETWWLHMHDGRRPGLFTPGLRTWYDRHPEVVAVVDPEWEAQRGAPLAAHQAFADTGDIS